MSISRHQLRAARALLLLNQETLGAIAKVGITTIRKFENGHEVDPAILGRLLAAVQEEGAVIVGPGTTIAGKEVGIGVALEAGDKLPPRTREKLAALDTAVARGSTGKEPGRRLRVKDDRMPGRNLTKDRKVVRHLRKEEAGASRADTHVVALHDRGEPDGTP